MKTQTLLSFFAMHQTNAFISNVNKKAPSCLKSSYNPVSDTRSADTYRQGGPDMGYAVRIIYNHCNNLYPFNLLHDNINSMIGCRVTQKIALLHQSQVEILPRLLLKVHIHLAGKFSIISQLLRFKEDHLKHGPLTLKLSKLSTW